MADAGSAQEIASQILLVPADWFNSPMVIISLVIPLLTTGLFYYLILSRKVHIFRNTAVNLTLGYVFAFVSVPFFIVPNPSLMLFVTVFGIVTLLGDRITLGRLALATGAGIAAWAITGYGAYLISLFFV
ncbi:MAG: hypothetical protein NT016_02945 [Candidatus Aenigmarchaeota archaeon]|nr:hypothetical protein [Candidatus Aenigmarchaeota archaeon]